MCTVPLTNTEHTLATQAHLSHPFPTLILSLQLLLLFTWFVLLNLTPLLLVPSSILARYLIFYFQFTFIYIFYIK